MAEFIGCDLLYGAAAAVRREGKDVIEVGAAFQGMIQPDRF